MTKRDYELIASALAEVEAIIEDIPDKDGMSASTLRLVVDRIAAMAEKQNPRFRRGHFEIAAMPISNARLRDAIIANLAKGH